MQRITIGTKAFLFPGASANHQPLKLWIDFMHTVAQVENSLYIFSGLKLKLVFGDRIPRQTDHVMTLCIRNKTSVLRVCVACQTTNESVAVVI
eukprot:1868861-Karenia_brevis.AAC.1